LNRTYGTILRCKIICALLRACKKLSAVAIPLRVIAVTSSSLTACRFGMVCIAVLFFFPWGLVAWLIFRPDPIDPEDSGS
jgi:hypothetical protein